MPSVVASPGISVSVDVNPGAATPAVSAGAAEPAGAAVTLPYARADLSNVSSADFLAKGLAAGLGQGQGSGPTVSVVPTSFGAVGDGATDDYTALVAAANSAVANGRVLVLDRPYAFGAKWTLPAGLVLRSDFSDARALRWIGGTTTDCVEITGACDIDGLVIDANRPGASSRTSTTVTKRQCVFGVHGPMTTGAPSYLTGVRLGRIRVQNTQARVALALVNVDGLVAEHLEVRNSWGAAYMLSGLANSRIQRIMWDDVGALQQEGSRLGQGIALFAESDPQKLPAQWYTVASQSNPAANIKPTYNVEITEVIGRRCTDTAVYVHDYPTGSGIGVDDVRFGVVDIDLCGKDAFKTREYATRVSVANLKARRVGNRFAVVENYAANVTVSTYDCDQSAYDVVGDILGTPAVWTGGPNNGAGQTLTTSPGGVFIGDFANGVTFGSGVVRNVKASPADGTQGHGLYIADASRVRVNAMMLDTVDANGLRISHATDFKVDATVRNACRATYAATNGTQYFGYVNNDGGGVSSKGALTLRAVEASGSALSPSAFRLNDACDNINIEIIAKPTDFTLAGLGVVSKVDSLATNIRHKPVDAARVSFSGSTNAAGQLRVAHGLYARPALPVIRSTLVDNRLAIASVDATYVTLQLLPPTSTVANYIPNPTFSGAVAGTPGTLPTGITNSATIPGVEVIGTGQEGGNDYWDVRLFGTPSSTAGAFINLAGATAINAALGDAWTLSGGLRKIAGSTTGLTGLGLQVSETDFTGVSLVASTVDFLATATDTTLRSAARTVTRDGTSHIQPLIRLGLQSGVAFDITLRIGGSGGEITLAKNVATTSRAIAGEMDVEVRNANGY